MAIRDMFVNPEERRLRAGWRLLVQGLLQGTVSLLLAAPLGIVMGASRGDDPSPEHLGLEMALTYLVTMIAILLSVWLAGRWLDRRPFSDFGFRLSRGWWLDFAFGLALGGLLMTGILVVELAAGWIVITETLRVPGPTWPFALAILVPVLLFIAVGVQEEVQVRGYHLHNLAEGMNLRFLGPRRAILLAWLVSSLIFSLLHLANPNTTIVSVVNLLLGGLFLGLAYILTGELAIPIGLHITWNFFQGNVFGFPVSGNEFVSATFIAVEQRGPDVWTGGAFGPEAGLIGVGAMIVGSALILLWVRQRYGKIGLALVLPEPPVKRPSDAASNTR